MNPVQIVVLALFVIGYTAITFEHQIKAQKAPVAMILAVLMWGIIALFGSLGSEHLTEALELSGSETFSIVIFLLLAMTLVEILLHYQLFDWIRVKLFGLGLDDAKQFAFIFVLTFFLSALLDNLTITIVMVMISKRFFKGKNLLIVAAGIVISANAGGAWSPIGDVTTIMLWIAHKFTAGEIIADQFLASLVHAVVAFILLSMQLEGTTSDSTEEPKEVRFTRSELVVISVTIASFFLPLIVSQMGLPPFMGLLFGLAVVWLCVGFFKLTNGHVESHLDADIEKMFGKTDLASLLFFTGILSSVAALNAVGVLEQLSHVLLGADPSFNRIAGVNTVLGYLSGFVDNVPLTALAIRMIQTVDVRLWTFLAYTAGTGGSHLVIGSAAGVVAMGMVPELTSGAYFKIATRPVFVAYLAGIAAWWLQVMLLGF